MNQNPTVVFAEPNKVVVENREVPIPQKGQLLIKTGRTLISTGTELTMLSGDYPPDSNWARLTKYPLVPGYDHIGKVTAVGEEVDPEWVGRRVASYSGHALYVAAEASSVRWIRRDTVSDEHASFFAIAEIVMNSIRRGRVQWGEAVAVYGVGLLGQFAVRFCRMCGARPVFGVDVADSRLERLPKEVAVLPVNPRQEDLCSVVREATRGRMVDVAFEVTGDPDLIADQFKVLRPQGRFVVLSSPRGKTIFDFHDLCNSPSYTIIGTHNGSHPRFETFDNPWTIQRDAEFFFDLVADGELDLDPMISHRANFAEAPRLYEMLLQDRSQAMGVVLEWSE